MTSVTYMIAPLARLKLSPLNARFGRPVETADLEASITGAGRLIHPLDVYKEGEDLMVWDGGRRLLALQALAAGGKKSKLPKSLKDGIPCLVSASADEAALNSLATFVRAGMTAADQFLAFKTLLDKGLTPTEIAAACDVKTPRVNQLLRLVALAPECLEAFRAGTIPLDVAEALTITDDHERQRSVLAAFNPKKDNAWGVRQAMRKGAMSASDSLARFVGREAYVAAGGKFLLDLFQGQNENEDWLDADLARELANAKLADLIATVKAEGWADVEVLERKHYDWDKGLTQLPGKKGTYTAEQMAGARAFVHILHNGQPEVLRGFVKKGKSPVAKASEEKAASDPAMFGYGHGGHFRLTHVATDATRVALLRNPAAAYDAMLTHLAWATLRTNSPYDATKSSASSLSFEYGASFHEDVAGKDEFYARFEFWRDRLAGPRVAFCEAIAALSADEKAELLALCFANTLRAAEARFDGYDHMPTRWAHLGWMAKHAGLNMADAWKPDGEIVAKASKDALQDAIRQIGGTYIGGAAGEGLHHHNDPNAKKRDLQSRVLSSQGHKDAKPWMPKLLATLTDVSVEAEAAQLATLEAEAKAANEARAAERAAALKAMQDAGELDGADAPEDDDDIEPFDFEEDEDGDDFDQGDDDDMSPALARLAGVNT